MKSFKITSTYNLADLDEDAIRLKRITSDKIDNLTKILVTINKNYPDDSKETIIVKTYDPNLLYSTTPEINIDFMIQSCSFSIMEIKTPIGESFEIFYET